MAARTTYILAKEVRMNRAQFFASVFNALDGGARLVIVDDTQLVLTGVEVIGLDGKPLQEKYIKVGNVDRFSNKAGVRTAHLYDGLDVESINCYQPSGTSRLCVQCGAPIERERESLCDWCAVAENLYKFSTRGERAHLTRTQNERRRMYGWVKGATDPDGKIV